MQFVKVATTDAAAGYVAGLVNGGLAASQNVLLLLPGGSSIAVAAAAYHLFDGDRLEQLTMMLTDERYGDVGHPDSNWAQLAAAGVPVLRNPHAVAVLTGLPLADTAARYDQLLRKHIAAADIVVGMFGMGTDGHTAGILPNTPATAADGWAVGYKGHDFQRITMTFEAVRNVDAAILTANGASKAAQLAALSSNLPLSEQPVQILKTIHSLRIFSDTIGDDL